MPAGWQPLPEGQNSLWKRGKQMAVEGRKHGVKRC